MPAARSLIRIAVNVAVDALLAAIAVPVARWIADPAGSILTPLWLIPAGALALLVAGVPFRLSRQYWRFAGLEDLLTVAASSATGAMLFALIAMAGHAASPNPAFPVVHALTMLVLLGAPRVYYRRLRLRGPDRSSEANIASILLIGEGEDADLFLRAMAQDRRKAFQVEGLLAPTARLTGRRIQGYPILGSVADAGSVLEQLRADARLPDMLVIASPDPSGAFLATILAQADRFGLQVRRAPRPTALDHHTGPEHTRPLELKPVAIEDLLNRAQVPLDRDGMARLIQGRRVVVTGAGGTIGSELARQVAAFGP